MPMYYFCLHDNEDVVDADGTDLPDLDSAREHARQVVRELTFRRDGMLERSWSKWTMWVQDNNGEVLWSFPLGDVDQHNWPTGGRNQPIDTKKGP